MHYTEEKACNLCGSRSYRTVYVFPAGQYSHERFETAGWDGRQHIPMTIVECRTCGLRFTCPSFKEEFLDLVYPPDIIHKPEKVRKSFDVNGRKANAILEAARSHSSPGATLLDIGTRYGALPYIAQQKYGFDAHGVELNAASVEQGRQFFSGISQGTIADVPQLVQRLGWSRLDVIVMDDVVEHLVDPRRDLQTLASAQSAGDLLLLRTMDSSGWGSRIFGENWYYYSPAAHMFYFDESSLGRLLRSVGYEPIEVRRTSLARNLSRLLRRRAGRQAKRWLGRAEAPRGPQNVQGRPSQLSLRQRLDDDLFLMVARRR